jgi:HAD superfamily phosphoserine phosphatase-like hydrolase
LISYGLVHAHAHYLGWQLDRDAAGTALHPLESVLLWVSAAAVVLAITMLVGAAAALGLLIERPVQAWRGLRDEFVADRILPRLGARGRAAVADHRERGDTIAVVTATHDFLVEGIVASFGDIPIVASRCEVADGRFTGRLAGAPCFGAAKPACVRDWLHATGRAWEAFEVVRFYSDSVNDLPLLEAATEPVVVDPDPRLAAIAAERGWLRLGWAAGPATA